jgi:AhpD family alkylhydroperoxidase
MINGANLIMEKRLNYGEAEPGARKALLNLESYVEHSGLELSLLDLVKIRASQLNGCAYCLDMHIKDARASGESEERLYMLSAWHEASCYTPRERAAIAWSEAITLIAVDHVPDAVYQEALKHFDETELVKLTMAVIAINSWNRIGVAFKLQPGLYQSKRKPETVAG